MIGNTVPILGNYNYNQLQEEEEAAAAAAKLEEKESTESLLDFSTSDLKYLQMSPKTMASTVLKESNPKVIQRITKLNTRRNSGYQHCVIKVSPQARPISPLLDVLQAADEAGEEDVEMTMRGDIIPKHDYKDEIVDPEADPIPFKDAGEFHETELPPLSDLVSPKSPLPSARSRSSSVTSTSSSVQWSRRVSITKFDNRNAPVEIKETLTVAFHLESRRLSLPASPRKRSLPAVVAPSLPIPLRRLSADHTKSPMSPSGFATMTSKLPKPILKSSSCSALPPSSYKVPVSVLRLPTDEEIEAKLLAKSKSMDSDSESQGSGASTPSKRKRAARCEQTSQGLDAAVSALESTVSSSRRKRSKSLPIEDGRGAAIEA